jgi:hypothetical protein
MSFLVGAPSSDFMWSTATWAGSAAWATMNAAFALKYVMQISTPSGSDTTASPLGIPYGHAYTVLGTYILHNAGGSVLDSVIKVRNPWGRDSFNSIPSNTYSGTWCDTDTANWS